MLIIVSISIVYYYHAGTCINNTSVFMFKKGCFELGATIYPVVIKVYYYAHHTKNYLYVKQVHVLLLFLCNEWVYTAYIMRVYVKCNVNFWN